MNRQMHIGALLALFLGATAAFGQGIGWDQAWSFRETTGIGSVTDSAALGLPGTVQDELAGAIRESLTTFPADAAVLDALLSAGEDVSGELSWGRDPGEAYARLELVRDTVIQEFVRLVEEIRNLLPVGLRPYLDRAQANAGIDSPYRLLELNVEQRDEILALQRERDRVLLDARQWHRPARLDATRQAFEGAVSELLTAEQQAELAQFQANIAANLEAVLDRDLANYPEGPNTAGAGDQGGSVNQETESGGQATAVSQGRGHPLGAALAELVGHIRGLMAKLTAATVEVPVAMGP